MKKIFKYIRGSRCCTRSTTWGGTGSGTRGTTRGGTSCDFPSGPHDCH